jgi:hypothetical protein
VWEVVGLVFIIYQSIVIPFRLCFDSDAAGGWKVIEAGIDYCFLADILVQFNTAFYRKGILVYQRWEITKNYAKTWFIIDLAASFPYSLIIPENVGNREDAVIYKTPQLLKLVKFARFLKFLRLLRVLKLK